MTNRTRLAAILTVTGAFSLYGSAPLRAQVVDKAQPDTKAIKAEVEDSVGWYQVYSDAIAREPMTPHRVLRWQNSTRGTQESDGVLVLWVHKGRPEASVSVYPWEGSIAHELVSLSRSGKLVARDHGQVIWSPETPGVTFQDIPGAPAPAGTPALRLTQMKALADRFKATMTGWKADRSDREELRLLPKPLYRYESIESAGKDPGWIDGAVFAFVQGTDPEALLLLEAINRDGRPRWQFAFARATSGSLEARLDKTVVWAVDFLVGAATPRQPQMSLSRLRSATAR
jgi:hypothetical protein